MATPYNMPRHVVIFILLIILFICNLFEIIKTLRLYSLAVLFLNLYANLAIADWLGIYVTDYQYMAYRIHP